MMHRSPNCPLLPEAPDPDWSLHVARLELDPHALAWRRDLVRSNALSGITYADTKQICASMKATVLFGPRVIPRGSIFVGLLGGT